jgi:hypothetical protein
VAQHQCQTHETDLMAGSLPTLLLLLLLLPLQQKPSALQLHPGGWLLLLQLPLECG